MDREDSISPQLARVKLTPKNLPDPETEIPADAYHGWGTKTFRGIQLGHPGLGLLPAADRLSKTDASADSRPETPASRAFFRSS